MTRRSRYRGTILYEVGELEYEATGLLTPSTPSSYDDPGDGPEVEFTNIVQVHTSPDISDVCTFETFVREYAASHRISEDVADKQIVERAIEVLESNWRDSYDDDQSGWYDDGD